MAKRPINPIVTPNHSVVKRMMIVDRLATLNGRPINTSKDNKLPSVTPKPPGMKARAPAIEEKEYIKIIDKSGTAKPRLFIRKYRAIPSKAQEIEDNTIETAIGLTESNFFKLVWNNETSPKYFFANFTFDINLMKK